MSRYALLAATLLAASSLAAHGGEDRWPVRETKALSETFPLAAGAGCHVIVDNLEGPITVTAGGGHQVVMRAQETVRARDAEDAALARREVRLDIDRRGGVVELYVDGPFRCRDRWERDGRGDRWGGWCDSGRRRYSVAYDFTLEVPARCDLDLSTVNRGKVTVHGVAGRFDIQSVNGPISLEAVAGSGRAHTVNGEVSARFAALPDGPIDLETLNGDVDATFGEGLSADFQLKTFSGEMWSEFAYSSLPAPVGGAERENGRFVYRQKGEAAIRVGGGGQRARLVTFNGDVVIRRATGRAAGRAGGAAGTPQ